jgi:23S rRNA (guanosine2251-2'-O)-methyltransferase
MKKLSAKELRLLEEAKAQELLEKRKRQPIYFILEDIFDTYNIGGLFRLADALAAQKIFLCGQTETPPNPKIKKASVGTYKVVPWEYKKSVSQALLALKKEAKKVSIVAIEQSKNSQLFTKIKYQFPIAFIVGNETKGIKTKTLALADKIVEIPMFGLNKSLNVIVAAAIVSYFAISQQKFFQKFN